MDDFHDGLPVPRRYWAIAAIVLAISVAVLDASIANIALPSIARDFHAATADSIWVINAYQVTILVAVLPLASLGEGIGYRRVSQGGLIVFTLASLGCACAESLWALSLARVLQGLGAAALMSVYGALVRFTYPRHLLGRAIGINSLAAALSSVIGPSLAAAILAAANWRWLFGINVPIGLLAYLIGARALPDSQASPRPFNYVAMLLNVGTFGLLIIGLQTLAQESALPAALVEIAAAGALGWLLVRYESDRRDPLLPLDLLGSQRFSLSVLTSVTSFIAASVALIGLPFEIQRLGHSAAQTGLLMTPWPVALTVVAPIAGRLADRYPPDVLGGIGLALLGCGLGLLALYPPAGSVAGFLWLMCLCGVGFGLFQVPNNRAILSAAPLARSGAAGAVQNAARLLGQSLGAAGVAILFRFFPQAGSNFALRAGAIMAVAAAAISMTRLRWARTSSGGD